MEEHQGEGAPGRPVGEARPGWRARLPGHPAALPEAALPLPAGLPAEFLPQGDRKRLQRLEAGPPGEVQQHRDRPGVPADHVQGVQRVQAAQDLLRKFAVPSCQLPEASGKRTESVSQRVNR